MGPYHENNAFHSRFCFVQSNFPVLRTLFGTELKVKNWGISILLTFQFLTSSVFEKVLIQTFHFKIWLDNWRNFLRLGMYNEPF
jgi:hypothetical protein